MTTPLGGNTTPSLCSREGSGWNSSFSSGVPSLCGGEPNNDAGVMFNSDPRFPITLLNTRGSGTGVSVQSGDTVGNKARLGILLLMKRLGLLIVCHMLMSLGPNVGLEAYMKAVNVTTGPVRVLGSLFLLLPAGRQGERKGC